MGIAERVGVSFLVSWTRIGVETVGGCGGIIRLRWLTKSKKVVVQTVRGDNIRLISARKASKKERTQYEENAKKSGYA
jgi:hypothetical protein